jgi:hypothetical protein
MFISLYNIEMNIGQQVRALCTPAKIYFLLSVVSILAILSQNYLGSNIYIVGNKRIQLPHSNILYFVFKITGVLIWTFILQELCKSGYKNITIFFYVLVNWFNVPCFRKNRRFAYSLILFSTLYRNENRTTD